MTTKAKLSDTTKEINQQAGSMLEEVSRVKRNIDNLLQAFRKQEAQFQRDEAETLRLKKAKEQQELAQQHAKAWTMPDDPLEKDEATDRKAETKALSSQDKTDSVTESAESISVEAKAKASSEHNEDLSGTVSEKDMKAEKPVQVDVSETQTKKAEPSKATVQADKDQSKNVGEQIQRQSAGKQSMNPRTPGVPNQKPANAQINRSPVAQPGQISRTPAASFQQINRNTAGIQPGQYGRPAGQPGQFNRNPAGQPSNAGRFPSGQQARPQYGQPGQPVRNTMGQPVPFNRSNAAQPGQINRGPNNQYGQFNRNQSGQLPTRGSRPIGGNGMPNRGPQKDGQRGQGGQRRSPAPELLPVMEKEPVSNYDPNKRSYVRQHDPEHVSRNMKQISKELESSRYTGYDDDQVRGGKRAKPKKQLSAQQKMAPIKIDKAFMTAETITVKDLSERIGKPGAEILKKLFMLGIVKNINGELDFDTASLVCSEFGVELEMRLEKTAEDTLSDVTGIEDMEEELEERPPVITIMGHVDHGKTSLLDYIRKTKVTANEAGGITQHIGAYTAELNGRKITFLDTPGHEAFTAMRLRGAQATDIAVLVVAADDGVMPQTIEAINHAKAADVPIIVAINKIDKQAADPERVKQELTKYNLVPEEWGGETIMAPVSALTGEGVDELLEMILLQADVMQLRANPKRMARGVIIEAKLDKARGPLATVLIQNGTLHIGDNIVAGLSFGRVRAMVSSAGERVQYAGPSTPVEVSGFTDVPSAGDDMMAVEDDRLSRQVVEERRDKIKASRVSTAKVSLDNLFAGISEGKVQTLNIIIKADVQGSVEAVKQAIEKLSNDQVKIRVLHNAVGAITQDDVNLASAFNAIIIGFNIRPDATARNAADKEGVDIRLYRIIYQAIEDIEKAMKGLLEPEYKEVILGHAEVRNVFRITGAGTIAGCYVQDGKVQRNAKVRLLRDNAVIFEGKLSSLRRFKDDVRECAQGYECGIGLENYGDIKENDVIECFILEEIEH